MRGINWFLFMVLFACGQPARADVTANYYVWGPLGPSMRIQVSDSGHARIQIRGETVAIRRDGVLYLVRGDDSGLFVITLAEFQRIEARQDQERGNPFLETEIPPAQLVERGTERVGGRDGIVLSLVGPDDTRAPSDTRWDFVVSTDADLAPVRPLINDFFGGGVGSPMPIAEGMTAIFARGTLIRMAILLRLESTSDDPIPLQAFELPGPVVSGEEAEARLGPAW